MNTPPPHSNRRIKDMMPGERPQERLEKQGVKALSDKELLAMILRSGPRGVDVLSMSEELLKKATNLNNLLRLSAEEFQAIRGIGKVKSLQLIAVMEFARRILQQDPKDLVFNNSEAVAEYFETTVVGQDVECFWVLCLDRKNRLLKCIEITRGTATGCLAHPREVFKQAIQINACAIIAVHNHPSGDPAPSQADKRITKQLHEAAEIIGIQLLDHVIVGQRPNDPKGVGYYSFNEAGWV